MIKLNVKEKCKGNESIYSNTWMQKKFVIRLFTVLLVYKGDVMEFIKFVVSSPSSIRDFCIFYMHVAIICRS
jgi:hypothetical protein